MYEILVAIFETEELANHAITALTENGVNAASIRRYGRDKYDLPTGMAGADTTTTGAPADVQPHSTKGGFWSWLLGEESGTADYHSDYEQDYDSYHRQIEAGRVMLSITVEQSEASRVMDILAAQSPIRLEDTGPTSRTEVPTGTTATPTATTAARPSTTTTDTGTGATAATTGTPKTRSAATTGTSKEEEVIPLAQENVEIGKRKVESATPTYVRRYVTERPVEREVTLTDEHVEVERRRPTTTSPGEGSFQERVVEARDTREEPVVEKSTRVGEEVVVRKEKRTHPEKVQATERKEEVDVKKGRSKT